MSVYLIVYISVVSTAPLPDVLEIRVIPLPGSPLIFFKSKFNVLSVVSPVNDIEALGVPTFESIITLTDVILLIESTLVLKVLILDSVALTLVESEAIVDV